MAGSVLAQLPGAKLQVPAEVREVPIPVDGVAGQSLRDARIRERFGVTVVAIIRPDGVILNPSPDATIRVSDRLRLFGRPEQIDAFMRDADPRGGTRRPIA